MTARPAADQLLTMEDVAARLRSDVREVHRIIARIERRHPDWPGGVKIGRARRFRERDFRFIVEQMACRLELHKEPLPEGFSIPTDVPVSFVYFIRGSAWLKVGVAKSVLARLTTLQTGFPERLEIFGVTGGARGDEQEIHQRLAAHRAMGEWFRFNAEVENIIREEIARRGGVLGNPFTVRP